jgi:hypothetical protein
MTPHFILFLLSLAVVMLVIGGGLAIFLHQTDNPHWVMISDLSAMLAGIIVIALVFLTGYR